MKRKIDLALGQLWVCPDGSWRVIDYFGRDYVTYVNVTGYGGNCLHSKFRQWIRDNKAVPGRVVPMEDAR